MGRYVIIKDEEGNSYGSITDFARLISKPRSTIASALIQRGVYHYCGKSYFKEETDSLSIPGASADSVNVDPEYTEYLKIKNSGSPDFLHYDFTADTSEHHRYAVALFSDMHFEEGVTASSTLGLNEYDTDMAEQRVGNYFARLVRAINEDGIEELVFACLGDLIDGYLRESSMQENGLTPIEAVLKVQSLLYSGLSYVNDNTNLKRVIVVGLTGNHGRTTRKIQSNNVKLNYEYLIYHNVKRECEHSGIPFEFAIPDSEIAVVTLPDGKVAVFAHGWQIKSQGTSTVCGIYPALNRLSMKWQRVFGQEHLFIGHFHSVISIPHVSVNGSIIGYNAFSMANGFSFERPAQLYQVFEENQGIVMTRTIYCD